MQPASAYGIDVVHPVPLHIASVHFVPPTCPRQLERLHCSLLSRSVVRLQSRPAALVTHRKRPHPTLRRDVGQPFSLAFG